MSQSPRQDDRTGPVRGLPELTGPWPRIAQILWLATLLVALVVLIFSVQKTMHQVHHLCGGTNCQGAELRHEQAHLLHQLGLPVEVYGIFYSAVVLVLVEAAFWAVGGLAIWRRPRDPMAVLTAFTLLLFGSVTINGNNPIPPGLPPFLDLLVRLLALAGSYALLVFFYLFPSGRLVIRWPLLLAAPELVFQGAQYLAPGSALDTTVVPNNPRASQLLFLIGFISFIVALASLIYVQVYRYRRVSTPSERQQTKWVVYGASASIGGYIALILSFFIPGLWDNPIVQTIGASNNLFLVLIPLSIGFAILRYRLWDVDILINRTLVYGLLTASLALVYVGGVVGLQALFRLLTGQGSGLAVAISTLAIAALFQPWRRGIQAFIDRRFYRQKYDASRTLARFAERVRDDVNLDELAGDIVSVVQETMEPSHVSLWLRPSHLGDEAGA